MIKDVYKYLKFFLSFIAIKNVYFQNTIEKIPTVRNRDYVTMEISLHNLILELCGLLFVYFRYVINVSISFISWHFGNKIDVSVKIYRNVEKRVEKNSYLRFGLK